jgi:hypothetical protein
MKMAPNGILLRYIGYILFVSLSFFVHPSFAQWDFYLSLHREYNTNPFRLPYTESTWFSSAGFGLEYRFDESLFSGYHGSYSNFDNIGDRSFYWHQGYLQGGSDELGWALLGEQRLNSDLFDIYDYTTFGGFVNGRVLVSDFTFRYSANAAVNKYSNYKELNNKKLWGSVQLSRTLSTKTTIITGSTLNYKRYDEPILLADEIYQRPHYYRNQTENLSVTQLVLSARVAQSITPTTGLAGQYHFRSILTGINRTVTDYLFNGILESEMFDDPMAYEGHTFGAELTQLFPWGIIGRAAYYRHYRDFPAEGIFTAAETYNDVIMREDTFVTGWITFQKYVGLNSDNSAFLVFSLNFQLIENVSNSYWFEYKNRNTFLNIDLHF